MDFQKVRVLIVEDSIQDFLIFKELLGQIREFFTHLEHASDMEKAQQIVQEETFDIIFLDLYLPDSQGVQTFERLSKLVSSIPVVILSGLSDKSVARDIVKMGAQDFIVKNEFDSNLLEKAITYSIERKKYQDILQESEARYRTTFESVGVAIGEYDYTGLKKFLDEKRERGIRDILKHLNLNLSNAMEVRGLMTVQNVNDEVLSLFEMSSMEEFRDSVSLIYTDETIGHLERMVEAIWNGEEYFEKETIYKTKSGNSINVLNRVKFLGDDFGYYRALISVVNISTLKKTEQEVRNQSRLLQAVSESAAALLSTDSFEEGVDNALEMLLGGMRANGIALYVKSEEGGGEYDKFSSKTSSENFKNILPESWDTSFIHDQLSEGECVKFHRSAEKSDKTGLLIEPFTDMICAPVIINNEVWGVIAVLRSERIRFSTFKTSSLLTVARNLAAAYSRHEALEELEKLNEELERRVKERTEQLESTNKELESFSYSVSHDLRAPLRAINGFSSVLAEEYEDSFDEQGKHFLNNIKKGAEDMSHLIEDLLRFSRLGRKPIQMGRIDMNTLVGDVSTELKNQVSERDVEIEIHDLPPCLGDQAMIKQVLVNFIWNAIKYSKKEESTRIDIGYSNADDLVEYYVKDNGVGFDMTYVDKIFGVFQRLHQDTDFEGTGVGLAIVQRIITRHGGQVKAEGEENVGATFYFSLPATGSEPKLAVESKAESPAES